MNRNQLFILVAILVIVVVCAGYFYMSQSSKQSDVAEPATSSPAGVIDVASQLRVPDGWKAFQLNDEQMGIALSYPEGWKLSVSTSSEYAREVKISGEGYSVDITNIGTDAPSHGFTSPTYLIGGYKVKNTYEFFDGSKYSQIITMNPPFDGTRAKNILILRIQTPGNSKEITDRILSSIVFLK